MSPESSALASAPASPALLDDYLPPAGNFDEMRGLDGQPRPHWEYLLSAIQALGPAGIGERRREARRLIRENGVSYNVNGDLPRDSRGPGTWTWFRCGSARAFAGGSV